MSQRIMLRTFCCLLITLIFLFSGTSPVQAQAPANDNLADASVIDTFPYDTIADLTEATLEITDPAPTCGGGLGKTVWYRYTPVTDTLIEIDLWDGWPHEFDISVYQQVSGGLDLLKCDQFYDPPSYLWLTAGEVYYFMLNTSTSEPAYVYLRIGQVPPPPNDHYSQAEAVSAPFTQDIDIRAATMDQGEPIPTCVSASMGRTIWYSYTPDVVGSILASNHTWAILSGPCTLAKHWKALRNCTAMPVEQA